MKKENLFFDYDMEMERWWYVKFTTDDLLWCITYFVMAKIALQYSFRLFLISGIFFLYHFIDGLLFWYNFKTSNLAQWSLMAALILTIIVLILPIERWGKYKSMI